jgi:hypothetical protein
MLENPRLVSQLCSLERRTARGGRDSIDHPQGGGGAHDDVGNAVAGALVTLIGGPPMPQYGLWKFTLDRTAEREARQAAELQASKPQVEWARGSIEWLAAQREATKRDGQS